MTNRKDRLSKVNGRRILCVTSTFPRWTGDSTTPFVLNLAEDLQDLGWKVDVLAPHAEQGTASIETMNGVSVERFRYLWPKDAQTVCYHGGALINLRHKKSNALKLPLLITAEFAAILRRLATRKYDLLHTHWILPQGFTGVLAAKPLSIPHVLTAHGSDVYALKGRVLSYFKRFSLHNANAVTVNSTPMITEVEAIAPGLPNLHRIPMGVSHRQITRKDPRVIALRQSFRRGAGPLLIFVGRLVEEKGVTDLLRALKLVCQTLPNSTALIIGDGQDRYKFENDTVALGLEDRVTFTGWIHANEVPVYLAAGDVFVGPSWNEAQGLTFLEAMIARTPVVATRVGGVIDSIQQGHTGLLVSSRAPEQMANAIAQIVTDPVLSTSLVEAAYRYAIKHFSRTASAQAFSSLFSSLVDVKVEKTQGRSAQ